MRRRQIGRTFRSLRPHTRNCQSVSEHASPHLSTIAAALRHAAASDMPPQILPDPAGAPWQQPGARPLLSASRRASKVSIPLIAPPSPIASRTCSRHPPNGKAFFSGTLPRGEELAQRRSTSPAWIRGKNTTFDHAQREHMHLKASTQRPHSSPAQPTPAPPA